MSIRDDFFTRLNDSAKWDIGVSINRTNPLPIDLKSVFSSYAEMEEYAQGVLSYPGHSVAVVEEDGTTLYVLDQDKIPQEVGKVTKGDNSSISLTSDGTLSLFGFENATEGQQLRIKNIAETDKAPVFQLEWFTPSTDTVDGLQSTVGSLQASVSEINDKISGVNKEITSIKSELDGIFHYKGTQETYSDLTDSVNKGEYKPVIGDVWNIKTAGGSDSDGVRIEAGDNVVYNGEGWDVLSNAIDLAGYYTKDEVNSAIGAAKSEVLEEAKEDATTKANDAKEAAIETAQKALDRVETKVESNTSKITALQNQVGNAASDGTVATGLYAELDNKANTAYVQETVNTLQSAISNKADTATTDNLQSQIDTLNKNKADTATIEGYVSEQLKNYVTQEEKDTLESTLTSAISEAKNVADNVNKQASTNATNIGTLQGTVNSLTSTANDHEGRITGLETYSATKEELSAKADVSGLQEANNKISALQTNSATKEEVTTVSNQVTTNTSDIQKNTTDISEHETRITGLETNSATKTQVEEINSKLSEEVGKLQKADSVLGDRVTSLESGISGLSGAMHFKGVENTVPEDLIDYNDGDVIIVGNKEYVFNDGNFVEFGDVTNEAQRITNLEAAKQEIEGQISSLKTTVGTLPEDQASVIGYINNQVGALNTSVEAINTKVGALSEGQTIVGYIDNQITTVNNNIGASMQEHMNTYHYWNEF